MTGSNKILTAVIGILLVIVIIVSRQNESSKDSVLLLKELQESHLSEKEDELNALKKRYQDIIIEKDQVIIDKAAKIDKFKSEILIKEAKLKQIRNEVQNMAGDSLGIASSLNRILSAR